MDNNSTFVSLTDIKEFRSLKLDPETSLKINPKFVQYVTDDLIVFISGCNLILYDLSLRKQKFLIKKTTNVVSLFYQ